MVDRTLEPSRFQTMFPGKADPNEFLTPFDPGAAGIGTLWASAVGQKAVREAAKSAADSAQFIHGAVHGQIPQYVYDEEAGGMVPNPAWSAGAMETALNVATPSFTRSVLGTRGVADPNTLGIFASTGAKTANLDALKVAEEMAVKGASREEIWDATGWFKTRDGKWRFEIKDAESKIKELPDAAFGEKTLGEVLDHPELFAAYPEAESIRVVRSPKEAYILQGAEGSYSHSGGTINLAEEAADPRSILMHEAQHFVQRKENMSPGANSGVTTPYGARRLEELSKEFGGNAPADLADRVNYTVYKLTHGEADARNVQARMAKGYDKHPWETLDVPENTLIHNNVPAYEAGVPGYSNGGLVNPLDRYLGALGQIESGNNYGALGPETEKGNRAYGRYQVMDFNIPVWTKEVLGQSLTPQQFLENREAQDAVARAKFGEYVAKTGNPFDAASMWFSGRPMAQAGEASDVTGTSVPQYVGRFANALGMPMEQDASGIAAIDRELLNLQRERMSMDQGPDKRQRQRMISAITDYYQSTLPKQADFSLLRPMGRRG